MLTSWRMADVEIKVERQGPAYAINTGMDWTSDGVHTGWAPNGMTHSLKMLGI